MHGGLTGLLVHHVLLCTVVGDACHLKATRLVPLAQECVGSPEESELLSTSAGLNYHFLVALLISITTSTPIATFLLSLSSSYRLLTGFFHSTFLVTPPSAVSRLSLTRIYSFWGRDSSCHAVCLPPVPQSGGKVPEENQNDCGGCYSQNKVSFILFYCHFIEKLPRAGHGEKRR